MGWSAISLPTKSLSDWDPTQLAWHTTTHSIHWTPFPQARLFFNRAQSCAVGFVQGQMKASPGPCQSVLFGPLHASSPTPRGWVTQMADYSSWAAAQMLLQDWSPRFLSTLGLKSHTWTCFWIRRSASFWPRAYTRTDQPHLHQSILNFSC